MAVSGEITKGFEFVGHIGHTATPMHYGTAGDTVSVGDVVIDNGAGLIIRATADPTTTLLGVAVNAAVATGEVRYVMALPGVIYEATLEDQTNVDHALAATDLHARLAIQVDPGGSLYHYVDENDATNYAVTVIKFVDVATTVRARVWVTFCRSAFVG